MKEKIKRSIKYLTAILFLAPVAVLAQFAPPAGTQLPGENSTLLQIIQNVMMWLLAILGFIAVIGFIISGILYLVAAGDEDAQARAKRAMIYSITGVVVGLVGLVILFTVQRLFNATPNF